jgi:hypothetical protein
VGSPLLPRQVAKACASVMLLLGYTCSSGASLTSTLPVKHAKLLLLCTHLRALKALLLMLEVAPTPCAIRQCLRGTGAVTAVLVLPIPPQHVFLLTKLIHMYHMLFHVEFKHCSEYLRPLPIFEHTVDVCTHMALSLKPCNCAPVHAKVLLMKLRCVPHCGACECCGQ